MLCGGQESRGRRGYYRQKQDSVITSSFENHNRIVFKDYTDLSSLGGGDS